MRDTTKELNDAMDSLKHYGTSTSADEWCAEYDNDMWLGTYHFNHTVAMDRIKRVVSTPERSGEWQTQQLKEGWYTADFDFDTNEYIMKRCEDLPTITVQQANLLSYKDPNDLTPQQRKILWGDDYG